MIISKFWNVHPGGYMKGEWSREGLEAQGQVLLLHGPDHDHGPWPMVKIWDHMKRINVKKIDELGLPILGC